MRGTQSQTNRTCQEKNHFLFHRIFFDVTRTADTSLDGDVGKNIEDYRNVDGDRELSNMWTGFTRFTVMREKSAGWVDMVPEETDKKTNDLKARLIMARNAETYV